LFLSHEIELVTYAFVYSIERSKEHRNMHVHTGSYRMLERALFAEPSQDSTKELDVLKKDV